MPKTHYATVELGNESQPNDEWSETICGLELEPQHLTNKIEWVDCKKCLSKLTSSPTITK